MIQDVFKDYIIPRVEQRLKELCVMSDGNGNIILTDLGEALIFPIEQNTFTLKFSHGLATDWANELKQCKDVNFKFPFVFLNSERITYGKGGEVTIGEMVLATLGATDGDGNPVDNSNARDEQTIKPILNIIANLLVEEVANHFNVESNFNPDRRIRYRGQYEQGWSEYVDAIEFTNFKVQIINCL